MLFFPFKFVLPVLATAATGAGAFYVLKDSVFMHPEMDEFDREWEELMKSRLTPEQWNDRAKLEGMSEEVRRSVENGSKKFWSLVDKLLTVKGKDGKSKSAVLEILKLVAKHKDNPQQLKSEVAKLFPSVGSIDINTWELEENFNFSNSDEFLKSLEKYLEK